MGTDAREIIEDSVITTAIKRKMAADETTSPLNITVETNSGIVFFRRQGEF